MDSSALLSEEIAIKVLGEDAAGRRCKQTRLFRCYSAKPYDNLGPTHTSLVSYFIKHWIMADDADSSE